MQHGLEMGFQHIGPFLLLGDDAFMLRLGAQKLDLGFQGLELSILTVGNRGNGGGAAEVVHNQAL